MILKSQICGILLAIYIIFAQSVFSIFLGGLGVYFPRNHLFPRPPIFKNRYALYLPELPFKKKITLMPDYM